MKHYFRTMALPLIGLVLSINLASASTQKTTAQTDDMPFVLMPTSNIKSAKGSTEGGAAINAFNGSGLDAYGLKHDNTSTTAWRTDNGTGTAPQDYKYVAVQFNEPIDLAKMHIWNFNWAKYSNRGIKDLEVWVSSSTEDNVLASKCEEGSTVWTKAISTTLTQAPANNDYTGEDVVLEQTMKDVRWVIFLCVSNYGGGDGYCGLSEVQFYTDSQSQLEKNLVRMPTTNISAAFSSGAPKDSPINAFNGTGLTDNGDGSYKHATTQDGIWITTNTSDNTKQDCKQWLAVKFNEPIDLAKLHIWNMNWKNNMTSYPERNIKDVEIYVSTSTADELYNTKYNDPSGVWTLASTLDLLQAPATADYTGEDYVLAYTHPNVTWVMFRILTNYNETATTGDHYCGLSEVQFYVGGGRATPMPVWNVETAYSSGAAPKAGSPIYAFNGEGLSENGKHMNTADNKAWRTANTTNQEPHGSQWIAVKFECPIDIVQMHIWNLNWLPNYLERGVKDLEIYVSSQTSPDLYKTAYNDVSGVWRFVTSAQLNQADGTADYAGEDVVLPEMQMDVSWVLFRCISNHGVQTSYYGLSEVQFILPTPMKEHYIRPVTNGMYGTICLPFAATSFKGAEIYSVSGKMVGNAGIYIDQEDVMAAGVPYIFKATADKIVVDYAEGEPQTAGSVNGLMGYIGEEDLTIEANVSNYIIYSNTLYYVNSEAKIASNRAYIDFSQISSSPSMAPKMKRVSIPINGAPTSLTELKEPARAIKSIHNGQIIILRDGIMYNVLGQSKQ